MMTEPFFPSSRPRPAPINLAGPERSVSVAAGILLAAHGVRQGGLLGLGQLMLGAAATWRGVTGVCEVKQALAERRRRPPAREASRVISHSVLVNLPPEQVFEFCREPLNIGALIPWIDAIEEVADDTYEWRAHGPLDKSLRCTLVRSINQDARRLRWSTAWDGPWEHDVIADFLPAAEGTQIKVIVACRSTAGPALATLLGRFADKALPSLLRSIKAQMELGEVSAQTMGGPAERDFLFVHPPRTETAESTEPTVSPKNSVVDTPGY